MGQIETSIKSIQQRLSAHDSAIGNIEAQLKQRLPSQTYINPKGDVNAISLRSGRTLEPKRVRFQEEETEIKEEEKKMAAKTLPSQPIPTEKRPSSQEEPSQEGGRRTAVTETPLSC